jgi:hypothetical protein
MSDQKQEPEGIREKIKRAIWMYNRLIEDYPELYRFLKEGYENRRQNRGRNNERK